MSHFNHAANEWDSEGKIKLMGALAHKVKQELPILKQSQVEKSLDILDFGCGTGLFGLEFLDYAQSLIGIDTSQGMLDVFDQKAEDFPFIKSFLVDLEKNEINETPLGEKKFDLIVTSMVFHHLTHPSVTLGKLKQLLKPHGQVAIVDLEKEDGSFHPNNLEMGVKHHGFSNAELESWASDNQLRLSLKTINSLEKNSTNYQQFLAVYSL